jgi:hypothetical protein
MTTTETPPFSSMFPAHHVGAITLCAGNTFRDKGPAGHDKRIQRPASRFRFAKDGEMQLADLASRGRLVSIAANTRTTISTRKDDLRDIIRLLACTGARPAEISGLEVQDVDLQEMTINIRFNVTQRLKNKQSVRTVPVVDEGLSKLCGSGLLARGLQMLFFRGTGETEGGTVRRPRSANG